MINILIPEEIPSLNKGEAAIITGMMETFKILESDVKVTMFSIYYKEDKQRYSPEIEVVDARGIMPSDIITASSSNVQKILEMAVSLCKHLLFAFLYKFFGLKATKIMRRNVWEAYCKSDLVIICHDSLFSPLYHVMITSFCKFLGKRLVIYGATFNPKVKDEKFPLVKRILVRYLMKTVFRKVDLITLREELSYKFLQEIGVGNTPMYVTGDFPFLLKPEGEEGVNKIIQRESLENCKPMIGMTIGQYKIGLTFLDIKNPEAKYNAFLDAITRVVDYLTESLNVTVVFIPHCIGFSKKLDDRIIAKEVYNKVKHKDKVKVITTEYSPEELKGLIGKFALFVGMRLHSVVDAVSMNVPSIMLSDSSDYRAHGIIGKMLGQEKWVYNMENFHSDKLIIKINELWNAREKVKSELASKIDLVKKQTMFNGELLARVIQSV